MAINMNLLLLQENKVLRVENEQKIKKKARKRTSIGSDLFIPVQEGGDRILRRLKILNLGLMSALHNAAVAMGLLDIQYGIVLVNSYIFHILNSLIEWHW